MLPLDQMCHNLHEQLPHDLESLFQPHEKNTRFSKERTCRMMPWDIVQGYCEDDVRKIINDVTKEIEAVFKEVLQNCFDTSKPPYFVLTESLKSLFSTYGHTITRLDLRTNPPDPTSPQKKSYPENPTMVEVFAQVARFPNLQTLILNRKLNGVELHFEKMQSLTHLCLEACRDLTEHKVRYLSMMGNLTKLEITHTGAIASKDLIALRSCSKLTALNLTGCTGISMLPFTGMPQLHLLNVSKCPQITKEICDGLQQKAPDLAIEREIDKVTVSMSQLHIFDDSQRGFVAPRGSVWGRLSLALPTSP